MKTKVFYKMRNHTTQSMSIIIKQNHKNTNIIMLSCLNVVLLMNLILCNYVNAETNSENNKLSSTLISSEQNSNSKIITHATEETNTKYANESLVEARELFEDSTGLVWSQFLEDYVLRYNNVINIINNNDNFIKKMQ